ncbi:M16 family metallopeptidase [Sphingomonas lenta]|uniref:Peptidase M16 n=1 Tax=Sphingomonas lenta TaxID=1141887 RepID=A0A2A2SDA1_9SPHN|nr:pitrilysin family protein [Sphingomonas lenta]PAX07193.1 peptidase M16 [Sphingomonas lenta]
MQIKTLALAGVPFVALHAPAYAQTAQNPPPSPQAAIAPAVPVSQLVRQVDIPYRQFTLPNGLRVVVHEDRKAPVVAVSVWYDVGSKHEPKGKTGFAHLFEHLMFNGSENAPGEFFEPLKEVGATDYNGTTYFDRTNYFQTVPTAALERALFLESDRMGYLLGAVTQAKLDEQRGVVQNEKRQNDNNPYGLVQYKLLEGLFPAGHPYGHSTIGSMADLDAASLDTVKDWFRDHYGPNNAVLVLAGDIDLATARPLVEEYFGAIKRGPESKAPPAPIPTLPAPKKDVMQDNVAATLLLRSWVVPGLNDEDSAALEVAAGVLGGLSSSRLDNALVRREKLAVQVGANNADFAQLGQFTIQTVVRPGVDAAVVEKRLDEILADFIRTGPTADEVNRFVTTTVAGRIDGLESVGGFGGKAVALAEGALYSNDPGFYKRRLQALSRQTPESVRAAMRKWLTRPVYALNVVPGKRPAYEEAKRAAADPVKAAPDTPFQGTRGPLPPVGEVAGLNFPAVQRTRLGNGIEVVYAQRTAVPVTEAVVSFDAGVAADVPGKLGTQGMTLAVMDEGGTTNLDSIRLAEAKERLGAGIGTGGSNDRTTFSLEVPSANLQPGMALLADVVRNPAFREEELGRLKNQALAGIQQELTSPQALAGRVLPPLLYGPQSPYAKAQGLGDPKAVAALTRADLVAFQQAWLRPEKAKIFVVSDRPLAEITQLLEQRFGDWRGVGAAGTKSFGRSQPSAPKIVLVDRPDSPQSLIVAGLPTQLRGTQDLLAYQTANDALGGSFLSRVNTNLRETKGWSYGVRGSFNQAEYAAPYVLSAPVQADKTGPSIAELRTDVRDFVSTKPITQAEFDRAITGAIRALSGNFETSDAVLGAMQSNDLYKRPDNYYATITQKYRGFTRDQLADAMRRVIDPNRFVWVVVGSAAQVRPQLDSLGLPVEVVPAAAVAGGAAPAPATPAATK